MLLCEAANLKVEQTTLFFFSVGVGRLVGSEIPSQETVSSYLDCKLCEGSQI